MGLVSCSCSNILVYDKLIADFIYHGFSMHVWLFVMDGKIWLFFTDMCCRVGVWQIYALHESVFSVHVWLQIWS
jgi:hypothetical protein